MSYVSEAVVSQRVNALLRHCLPKGVYVRVRFAAFSPSKHLLRWDVSVERTPYAPFAAARVKSTVQDAETIARALAQGLASAMESVGMVERPCSKQQFERMFPDDPEAAAASRRRAEILAALEDT